MGANGGYWKMMALLHQELLNTINIHYLVMADNNQQQPMITVNI